MPTDMKRGLSRLCAFVASLFSLQQFRFYGVPLFGQVLIEQV